MGGIPGKLSPPSSAQCGQILETPEGSPPGMSPVTALCRADTRGWKTSPTFNRRSHVVTEVITDTVRNLGLFSCPPASVPPEQF